MGGLPERVERVRRRASGIALVARGHDVTLSTTDPLLLLDAAQSYQREVQRTNANVPAEVSALPARLRDPAFGANADRHTRALHTRARGCRAARTRGGRCGGWAMMRATPRPASARCLLTRPSNNLGTG